jgi:putative peptidoglycan lipid II flippase
MPSGKSSGTFAAVEGKAKLVRTTTGMALVTVVSRLSGLLRDKVLAAILGPAGIGDAYTVGFRAPNLFRQLLAEGALHATFIPTLAELVSQKEEEKTRAFVAAMLSTLLFLATAAVLLGVLLAQPLSYALAPAFRQDGQKFALTVHFTASFFPYLGFIALAAFFQGVLNVHGRFLLAAGTPIALNGAIAGAVLVAHFCRWPLPQWLVVGVLLGGFLQFFLLWVQCWRLGLPAFPGRGAFVHPQVRQVLKKAGPLVLSSGLYPLTVFLSTNLASRTGDGAVFCLYVASRVNELVYGVVVVQLFTALLPSLSQSQDKAQTLGFALRFQSLVIFPAMFFLLASARPVTGLLFGGGRFAPWAVEVTGMLLVFLALGMPALALSKLASGSFYAHHDTRQPVVASLLALATFGLAGSLLASSLGIGGVALALTLSQYVAALWLWQGLRRRGWAPAEELWPSVGRHGLAAACMGASLLALWGQLRVPLVTSWQAVALVTAVGLFGLGLYGLFLWLLRVPELAEMLKALRRGRG